MGCFLSKSKNADVSTIKKCDVSTQTPMMLSFEVPYIVNKSDSRDSLSTERRSMSYTEYRRSIDKRNKICKTWFQ